MLRQISKSSRYFLICLALVLLVHTIAFTRIYDVEPTGLGLTDRMPLTFWVGLATLGLLFFAWRESERGLAVVLILTIAFLYVVPSIVRYPVWLSNSYYPFGESVLTDSSGYLVDHTGTTLNSYHSWPLFLYFSSVFLQITGIPHDIILKYFPLLIISLFTLLVFLILRVKLRVEHAIFGAALFSSSYWLRQQYFGPPGIGYIFFLFNVLLVSYLFFSQRARKITFAVLFLLFFIAVTLTHILSSFMSLAVLIALYVGHRLMHRQYPGITFVLCLLSTTIFLSYNMFFAPAFFKEGFQTLFIEIDSMQLGLFKEPSRLVGSGAQILNYRSTLAIIGIDGIIASLGILALLKDRLSKKHPPLDAYKIFSVIFLVFIAIFAVTLPYGPHESYQRAFMFGLVPLSFICVTTLAKKPKVIPVVLLMLLFLNIPAQYGSDSYTLEDTAHLTGARFFAAYTPQTTAVLYGFSLTIRYYDPLKEVKFVTIGTLPFTSLPNASYIKERIHEVDYVIDSVIQNNFYYYFLRQNPLDQVDLSQLNRYYDNGKFRILSHSNETSP